MKVSVIIPTYNSANTIGTCLKSIEDQTYGDVEVIVVDNFSTDETTEIAKVYGAKVIKVRSERAKAKNIGLRHAKGEFVLFIDSDMELTPKVIEECVDTINSDDMIGGVIIPERSVGKSFWVKVRDFERQFYANTPIESARFFRRDLVLEVGGFDEEVVFFEESTLAQKVEKLGYRVDVRIRSVILHHEDNFSLMKWLRKKYYYGMTAWRYKAKYEYSSKQTSLLYRFGLFLNNKEFYSKPSLAFGVLTLKCLEFASAGLGYVVGKSNAFKCK